MSTQETPLAFAAQRATEETKPAFIAWLASMFRRKRTPVERNPLTSATKALIANLMAMR
ncbi:MAG: hypothetical protein WBA88_25650 [Pseudaminobacter sp.]